jgi:hypothetical protein
MAGIGKYTKKAKGKRGFNMRSGNGPLPFKMMGSSPLREDEGVVTTDGTSTKAYDIKQSDAYKKMKREKDAIKQAEFDAEKDLVKKYRTPEIIASEDGDTWGTSGRPKKYQVLQADGTYKTVTNPSGSGSLSADDIQNYTDLFESRGFKDSPAFE